MLSLLNPTEDFSDHRSEMKEDTQHAVNLEKVDKVFESNCSDDISEPLNEVSVNISDQNHSYNLSIFTSD